MIYFSYSHRWNIKNGLTDCGEPQCDTYNCSIDTYISNQSRTLLLGHSYFCQSPLRLKATNTYGVGVTKVLFRWKWFIDSNNSHRKREQATYKNITCRVYLEGPLYGILITPYCIGDCIWLTDRDPTHYEIYVPFIENSTKSIQIRHLSTIDVSN